MSTWLDAQCHAECNTIASISQDMIYPSLREIRDGFPEWLSKNEDKLDPEELTKRRKQQVRS